MSRTTCYTVLPSPVDDLVIESDGESLTALSMREMRRPRAIDPSWKLDPGPFREAVRQLEAYFAGELTRFDLPLAPGGTEFQQVVWRALAEIPFGERISYGELARRIGRPNASRAVGLANGRNPIGIIVPCHRVIGSGGSLTGYAGGLGRKRWLLEHEAAAGSASLSFMAPGSPPRLDPGSGRG